MIPLRCYAPQGDFCINYALVVTYLSNRLAKKQQLEELCMKGFYEVILIILGTIFVVLGVLGIFLPLLPTTPFLLLGASCYVKSSPNLYHWLLGNKYLGFYIKNYREGNGIPLKIKVMAIAVLWSTISYSVAFVVDNSYVRIFLGLIASAVTWHIVSRKALVQDDKQELLEIQELVESELNNENSVLSHENINTEET
jgi:uncharacterized membrane protein YbaN (DUF454 family)